MDFKEKLALKGMNRKNISSPFFALGSRDVDKRDKSPSASEAKTPVIRKGLEVDKFGFYHAQPVAAAAPAASSSSSTYDTSKVYLPLCNLTEFFSSF